MVDFHTTAMGRRIAERDDLRARIAELEAQLTERVKVETEAIERLSKFAKTAVNGIDLLGEVLQVWTYPEGHPQWQRLVVQQIARDILSALEATPPAPNAGDATRVYEPYPGAFDDILGPQTEPTAPKVTDEDAYERGRESVLAAITYTGSDGGIYNTFREDVDLTAALSGDAS